jgi:uncharacterized protein YyaL (SSP411 family)
LTLGSFASRATQSGRTVPMMLAAISTYHAGTPQVVIVGERAAEATQSLIDVVRRRYRPNALTVVVEPSRRGAIDRLLPWMAAMKPQGDAPTAYVCCDFSCQAPTTDREDLDRQLQVLG